jgi:hypothetical protein
VDYQLDRPGGIGLRNRWKSERGKRASRRIED